MFYSFGVSKSEMHSGIYTHTYCTKFSTSTCIPTVYENKIKITKLTNGCLSKYSCTLQASILRATRIVNEMIYTLKPPLINTSIILNCQGTDVFI